MLMTLLHILLWLVVIVLGLVVLLGLILALVPLRVEIRRRIEGPPLRIRLSAGPLHITRRFGGKSEKKAAKPGKKRRRKKLPPRRSRRRKSRDCRWISAGWIFRISYRWCSI